VRLEREEVHSWWKARIPSASNVILVYLSLFRIMGGMVPRLGIKPGYVPIPRAGTIFESIRVR